MFEIYEVDRRRERLFSTPTGTAESFDAAVDEAVNGIGGTCAIVRAGVGVVAYVLGGEREIYIVIPSRVPANWQPGMAGGHGVRPVLAPESIDYDGAMSTTSGNGYSYPAALAEFPEFRDTSWGNDVTDSLVMRTQALGPVRVWVAPASRLFRSEEMASRFSVELLDVLEDDEIEGDGSIQFQTDDPAELLAQLGDIIEEDDATKRFRLLDLGPARGRRASERSDLSDRVKHLELDEEDLTFNPSNKDSESVRRAKEKFEEFHRHEPTKMFAGEKIIPARVRELGPALFVLYASTKNDPDTGLAVKKPVHYIHEHDTNGVTTYTPVKSGGVAVPAWIRDADALVLLGKCLGYAWRDGERERESKVKPRPDLYATPCGRALLVIQDRREVIAMIWGGGLGVEARGIVG